MIPPPSKSLLYTKIRLYLSIWYLKKKKIIKKKLMGGITPEKISPKENRTIYWD
jgi:hypothetical protein